MISLNDVLLAMSNIPVDDPIAEIWGRGLQCGYKIIEYTGTLPINISANGEVLIDYRIYGADGNVGEATENLYDKNTITPKSYLKSDGSVGTFGAFLISDFIPVETGDYLAYRTRGGYIGCYNCIYDENKNFLRSIYTDSYQTNILMTIGSNEKYIRISVNIDKTDIAMVVKGSTAPTEYIPYGYKLPMTVIDNLAPPLSQWVDGYISINGNITPSSTPAQKEKTSDFIEVKPNTQYTFGIEGNAFPQGTNDSWLGIGLYRDDKTFISRPSSYQNPNPYTFLTPSKTKYVRLSYRTYGELLEPILNENSFSIPVYIGEKQLDEGEYVSFSEQKIYRDVGGTLTPTDPPVPFPEIPTIEGETVIDYDGDPKPSQMYIKYNSWSGWSDIDNYKMANGNWTQEVT